MAFVAGLQDVVENHPWAFAASVVLVSGTAAYLQSEHFKLRHIPTVGASSLPLLSYIEARKFFDKTQTVFQEGYERHQGRLFKVADMDRYIIVATGRKLIQELAALPDEVMSTQDALNLVLEAKHTTGTDDPDFGIDVIRKDLTRNLTALFPSVYDEITTAFDEYIPKTDDYSPVHALQIAMMIVARASNRLVIGLPYCRDQEYLERSIMYTKEVNDSQHAIKKLPSMLKPIFGPYLAKPIRKTEKRVQVILEPEFARRKALMEEHGQDYPGKNNDFLSWMMDAAQGNATRWDNHYLSRRLLNINFAAIHTSSSTWTHALYTLAAQPELGQPLREEIEQVLEEEGGMSKSALQKMIKLDSFFREVNRTNAIAGMTVNRMALQDYTFSDGTFIPKGTILTVPSMPHQMDADVYANPGNFEPFRFENSKEGDVTRKHFTTADPSYMGFGLGKHACPGRFFAGQELKAMMSYLLMNYDIRAEEHGVRPPNAIMGPTIMPNLEAKILFRKRQI